MSQDPNERRRIGRLSNRVKLKFSLQTAESFGFVINQSEHGLFLQARRMLKPKSTIIIWNESGDMLAKGMVAWNKQEYTNLGQEVGGMGIRIFESFQSYDEMMGALRRIKEKNIARDVRTPLFDITKLGSSQKKAPQILFKLVEFEKKRLNAAICIRTTSALIHLHLKMGTIFFIQSTYFLRNFLSSLLAEGLIPYDYKSNLESIQTIDRLVHVLLEKNFLSYIELQQRLQLFWSHELYEQLLDSSLIEQTELDRSSDQPMDVGISLSIWDILLSADLQNDECWRHVTFEADDVLTANKDIDLVRPLNARIQKLLRAAYQPIKLSDLLLSIGGKSNTWAKEVLLCEIYGLLKKA